MMVRTVIVVVGATLLTTLGAHAFEASSVSSMTGSAFARVSSLLGGMVGRVASLERAAVSRCPSGMILVRHDERSVCVDQFEASPSAACAHQTPASSLETDLNRVIEKCAAESVRDTIPWRHISQSQAAEMCARAGKQLITPEVWYSAAKNADTSNCVVDATEVARTGARESCVSQEGVYDLVGNVWEWTDGVVEEGKYGGVALPEAGYVLHTTSSGIPSVTTAVRGELGATERFWHDPTGVRGIMRGGYYHSGEDAGIYALHAGSLPQFAGVATGFRCMQ